VIGKQVKGTSFQKVLNYLHNKTQAERIGGNMAGQSPATLTAEFQQSSRLNPDVTKTVYHASLSVAREEEQTDARWRAIAHDYVKGMGFGNCQYVVYRHHDQEHDHIHIVASRIQMTDGKTVNDSWDYLRSERLLRELEATYHLQAVRPSREKGERSQTTGEARLLERTGDPSVRLKLQAILNEAIAPNLPMPQFIEAIQQQGISVKLSRRSNRVSGISYELEGVAFSGTHLGRDFTFPGLQKQRHLSYESARDDETLKQLLTGKPTQPQPVKQTKEVQEEISSTPKPEPPPLASTPKPSIVITPPAEEDSVTEETADTPEPVTQPEQVEADESVPLVPTVSEVEDSPSSVSASEPFQAASLSEPIKDKIAPSEITPLQRQAAEAIAPIAVAFFQIAQQEGKVTQTDDIRILNGNQYVMAYDRANLTFSLQAQDGRGELLRLHQVDGTDTLEVAQSIQKSDLTNFRVIEQALQQRQRKHANEISQ
jgi:hypothetical protein